MLKTKKLVSTVLAIGMLMSLNTSAFAQAPTETTTSNASQQIETDSNSIVPYTLKTISAVNTQYWDSHKVKFEFTASANVVYDNNLEKYTMNSITASRPSVTVKAFSGVQATITQPTISYIDGGRTAVLTSTATIQNASGYSDTKTVRMYLYCEAHDGKLTLRMF